MPECLLFAYVEQLPRLQAEQARQASMIAAFPHMTKQGARDWMTALSKAAVRAIREGFTWNGQQVSTRGLKARLAQAFGGGFSAE